MSKIENEYNKRFNNKEVIDFDFDADKLWNKINGEIPNKSNRKYLILISLLIFAVGSAGLFLYNSSSDEGNNQTISQAIESNNTSILNTTKEETTTMTTKHASNEHEVISTELNATQKKSDKTNNKTINSSSKTIFQKEVAIKPDVENVNFKEINQVVNHSATNTVIPLVNLAPNNLAKNTPLETFEKSRCINKSTYQVTSVVTIHDLKLLFNKKKEILTLNFNPPPFFTEEDSEPSLKKFSVDLYGGVNTTSISFQSVNKELEGLKNDTENKFYGSSFGLIFNYYLSNKLSINTGLEYHDMWTKFVHTSNERISVFKEDVILIYKIDAISLDTIAVIRGDTLIGANLINKIENHNQIKQWTIPLSVGYHSTKENWNVELQAGIGFHFRSSQIGKTIDLNSVVLSYDNSTDELPLNTFSLSYRISPAVSYQLNEKYSLSLRGTHYGDSNKLFGSNANSASVNLSSVQLGFSVGW